MKKFTFLLLIFCNFVISFSQESTKFTEKINEINIGSFNVFDLSGLNDFGIGYKHQFNSGALRINTGFSFHKTTNEDIDDDYTYNSKFLRIKPRIGYEFHRYLNRIQLYYGVDLVGSWTISESEKEGTNVTNYKDESKIMLYGFSPLIGLTVFITNTISISTETSLDFFVSNTENNYKSGTYEYINNTKTFGVDLSPLGVITINLHF